MSGSGGWEGSPEYPLDANDAAEDSTGSEASSDLEQSHLLI